MTETILNNILKILSILLLILTIITILISSGKLPMLEAPQNVEDRTNTTKYIEPEQTDAFPSSPRMHWNHMPLTYTIDANCSERQINLTKLAFLKIKEETDAYVFFEETETNPDYEIYCKPLNYAKNIDLTIADAKRNPDNYNTSIIAHAEINFYGQGMTCGTGYPSVEIHEILHTLDFGHNPLTSSILNPYAAESSKDCEITHIDEEYTDCLKYIYSNGEAGQKCLIENRYIETENEPGCENDYYEVPGTMFCCPEPNMTVRNGACYN